MKEQLSKAVLVLCFAAFAYWQIADGIEKDLQLKAQAETLKKLEEQAGRIDTAMVKWRARNDEIAGNRQATRRRTRDTARNEPALQDNLAVPLHPALRRGGGLLGGKNATAGSAASPAAGHSRP